MHESVDSNNEATAIRTTRVNEIFASVRARAGIKGSKLTEPTTINHTLKAGDMENPKATCTKLDHTGPTFHLASARETK